MKQTWIYYCLSAQFSCKEGKEEGLVLMVREAIVEKEDREERVSLGLKVSQQHLKILEVENYLNRNLRNLLTMEEYQDLMVRKEKMAQLMSFADKMGRMVDID
jgi:hypothetical protein